MKYVPSFIVLPSLSRPLCLPTSLSYPLFSFFSDVLNVCCIFSTFLFIIKLSNLTPASFQCVVALTDQWYLSYGDPEWAQIVSTHIHSEQFNGYNDKIMESFDHVSKLVIESVTRRISQLGRPSQSSIN